MAVVGVGGRGKELIQQIQSVSGVRIVALCDPDRARTEEAGRRLPTATCYTDFRKALDDKNVDAVVIASPNHWHCLAAIWACQAGKHVYCEKPLSYRLWEGRQLISAVEQHKSILQVGTQQRSDPMQAEVKQFLHADKSLGEIKAVVIARFGVRAPIGKRPSPLTPPATVDYNLWLGPAQDEPIHRQNFHYDWHWNWNTGNGECGNWGVHIIDDVLNNVLLDQHPLPTSVWSSGGRVGWNDAGESPNVQLSYLEAGNVPVVFAVSNLPAQPKGASPLRFENVECGYLVVCEGGSYRGARGSGAVVDKAGRTIRQFRGDQGATHVQNFFDSVRANDSRILKAPVEVGHASANWAHLANAAYRTATAPGLAPPESIKPVNELTQLKELLKVQLDEFGLESTSLSSSRMLSVDPETEQFSGPEAGEANSFISKPNYRPRFAISS